MGGRREPGNTGRRAAMARVASWLRAAGHRAARRGWHRIAGWFFVSSLVSSSSPSDALLYQLGIVTRRRGQHATARTYFRMATPGHPQALTALLHTYRGNDEPHAGREPTRGDRSPSVRTSRRPVRRPTDRLAPLLLQRTRSLHERGAASEMRRILEATDWDRIAHQGVAFELAHQARLTGLANLERDALRLALTPLPPAVPDLADVLARLRALDPVLLGEIRGHAACLIADDQDLLAVVGLDLSPTDLAADRLFDLLLENVPANGGRWLRLARALRDRHLNDLAVRAAERSAELSTEATSAIWLLADLDARVGAGDRAVERVQAHLPELTRKERLRLARLAQRGGAPSRAVELLTNTAGWETEATPADLAAAATALHEIGRDDEALAVAARIDVADPEQRRLRLMWSLDVHRYDEAVELALHETDPVTLDRAARRLRRAGQIIDAKQVIERLDRLGRGRADVGFQRLRSQALVLEGSWRVAGRRATSHPPATASVDILHVVGSSLPHRQSGYTVRTQATLRAQAHAGLRVSAMTLDGSPAKDRGPASVLGEITYHHLLAGATVGTGTVEHLDMSVERGRRLVRKLRPRLLHAHSDFLNALVAEALGREFAIPVVYEMRGFWQETWCSRQADPDRARRSQYYSLRRARETDAANAADRVVTLAATMRDELLRDGIATEQIHIVPNAVDTEWFTPRVRDPGLRGQLGLSGSDLVVGYVSSLVDYEGIENLVRAVAELRRGGVDARGLIVGDGPERTSLAALAVDLGVADAVLLPGRAPHAQVRDYYAQMDAFVVPRHDVPVCRLVSPLKPLEAMAMQVPLAVSDLAVLREQTCDGRFGALFRADDPPHLAEVLARMADDPEGTLERSEQARSFVASKRTWNANAGRYLDLYAELGVERRGEHAPIPAS